MEVMNFINFLQQRKTQKQQRLTIFEELRNKNVVEKFGDALAWQQGMSLGDAIICTTALHNDLTSVTRNTKDFAWLQDLSISKVIKPHAIFPT